MEVVHVQPTEDSPEVVLNKERGIFKILGNSFPEDPFTLYGKIFGWLKEYIKNPNQHTVFTFRLNYINTASSRQIVEMLKILEGLSVNNQVTVNWYYNEEDEDTMNEGIELSNMFKLNFEILEE